METNPEYCCEFMRQQLTYTCETHGDGAKCPHVVVARSESQFFKGTTHLIARNGEYECKYCPSCGTKWPVEKSIDAGNPSGKVWGKPAK